jgi:hypothetical protein
LKEIEQQRFGSSDRRAPQLREKPAIERRASQRLLVHVPVLVHGQKSNGEPFHEKTEALSVNAGGALITLRVAVEPGQDLSLRNIVNEREQKCQVVYQGSAYLETTVVGVGFPQPFHDFWM